MTALFPDNNYSRMKPLLHLSAVTLIAMTGATFTACSNEEEVVQTPQLTGETVKTQFALSLPTTVRNARMTEDNTQADNLFNGMQNLRLYGFASTTAGLVSEDDDFSSFVYKPTSALSALETHSSKYYDDVEVPVGINNFLFYGKQTNATPGFEKGKTLASWDKSPASDLVNFGDKVTNITFEPVKVTEVTDLNAVVEAKLLIALLKQVEAATDGTTAWRDHTNATFAKLYNDFTTTTNPYGGSSASILAMLEDLYRSASNGSALASAIRTAITSPVTVDGQNLQINASSTEPYTLSYAADPKFPNGVTALSLPDGAAKVRWTEGATTTPKSPRTVAYVNMSIDGLNVAPAQYVYPAELYYTINSPIRVSDAAQKDKRGGSYTDWAAFLNGAYGTADGVVSASTKSVALTHPAQYGVANLKLTAKLASSTLQDNDEDNVAISVPTTGFKLTGVLVGDQKSVKWNFTQDATGEAKVVYDNQMNGVITVKAGAASTPNYTLVYESKGVTGTVSEANDDVVNVAIELENGDTDFFGQNKMLIPAHTKFYLVGKVKLSAIPEAQRNGRLKIFEQDYTTELTLNINSLKQAYNTMPDLRSPKLELGLAVDVTWRQGVTGEISID